MKKIVQKCGYISLSILFAVFAMLTFPNKNIHNTFAASENINVFLTANPDPVEPGQTVTIDVNATGIDNALEIMFIYLQYDATKVEYKQTVTIPSANRMFNSYSVGFGAGNVLKDQGIMLLSTMSFGASYKASGTLASLEFEVKDAAFGTSEFKILESISEFENSELVDNLGDGISLTAANTQSVSIQINGEPPYVPSNEFELLDISITDLSVNKNGNHWVATVPNATDSINTANILPSVSPLATFEIKISGSIAETTIPLIVGQNTIQIIVTAEDGTESSPYELVITREAPEEIPLSNNANLSALSITNASDWSPTFNPNVTTYSCTVPNNVTNANINFTKEDNSATVNISGENGMSMGANTVTILVTAEDGTTKTYTINVTRQSAGGTQQNNNANLSALSVDGASNWSPTFDPNITSYSCSVPNEVTNANVNATKEDNSASVNIGGETVLKVGNNTVTINVTAEDGTTKTYTINVTRQGRGIQLSSNANLSTLSVAGSSDWSPTFSPSVTSYSCTVPNNVTSINVNFMKEDTNSYVNVSGENGLSVGANTVLVNVTAEDGTTKAYTINVTRQSSGGGVLPPPTPNNDIEIIVKRGAVALQMAWIGTDGILIDTVPYEQKDNLSINIPKTFSDNHVLGIDGAKAVWGIDYALNLASGQNTVLVSVTNNDTTQRYFLKIKVAEKGDTAFVPSENRIFSFDNTWIFILAIIILVLLIINSLRNKKSNFVSDSGTYMLRAHEYYEHRHDKDLIALERLEHRRDQERNRFKDEERLEKARLEFEHEKLEHKKQELDRMAKELLEKQPKKTK